MSTFDPSTNHLNDDAVAAAAVDRGDAVTGRHARPPAEAERDAGAFASDDTQPFDPITDDVDGNHTERAQPNLSALDEVAHPFDQTNGIVEEVDRNHGETHTNDEQLDADPDLDPTAEDDEPGRESANDRRPLVNTALITEEVFGDDERKKPRFD
ncbi:hypothetical protein QCD70_16320 [Agreia sp. PsM10]|uniref:hypothetical protein n=1 Tax=Agreia sp. PsM10 TaxID=3030533 RepID=UPI00263AF525|nr:hypothetical protein [Agreia sp. PsM10]MDN4641816.1 hypothetical protein [Agreia sp. PsM10]